MQLCLRHQLYRLVSGRETNNMGPDASEKMNYTAEWHAYIDPDSTRIVFSSGAPITIVPLDTSLHRVTYLCPCEMATCLPPTQTSVRPWQI